VPDRTTLGPAERPNEPTLPDSLFIVPRNLPDIVDEPLGQPAAVVFYGPEIRTGLNAGSSAIPIVVGAYGDVGRSVRAVGQPVEVAISPDGTKLALVEGMVDDLPPTVVVADLVSGLVETFTYPDDGLGGEVYGLLWAPDGAHVVASVSVTVWRSGSGSEGEIVNVSLDVSTGQWTERASTRPAAFAADGRLEVRPIADSEGLEVAAVDGPQIAELAIPHVEPASFEAKDRPGGLIPGTVGAQFSPDGDRVALLADWNPTQHGISKRFTLEIFDSTSGDHVRSVELGDHEFAETYGWGHQGVVVALRGPEAATEVNRIDPVSGRTELIMSVSGERHLWPLGIPLELLDSPVRYAEPPTAPFDWIRTLPWLVVGVVIAAAWWLRNRQHDLVGRPPRVAT
jgi:hypothetical protein